MNISSFLVLALLFISAYSNCGCLKCNQDQFQVVSSPGSNIKLIYKCQPCYCSSSLPYSVQVPVIPRQIAGGASYNYQIQPAKIEAHVCPSLFPDENVKIQVPTVKRSEKYLLGLIASPDRILLPGCPISNHCGTGPFNARRYGYKILIPIKLKDTLGTSEKYFYKHLAQSQKQSEYIKKLHAKQHPTIIATIYRRIIYPVCKHKTRHATQMENVRKLDLSSSIKDKESKLNKKLFNDDFGPEKEDPTRISIELPNLDNQRKEKQRIKTTHKHRLIDNTLDKNYRVEKTIISVNNLIKTNLHKVSLLLPPIESQSDIERNILTAKLHKKGDGITDINEKKYENDFNIDNLDDITSNRLKRDINLRLLALKPENPPRILRKYSAYNKERVGLSFQKPHLSNTWQKSTAPIKRHLNSRRVLKHNRNNLILKSNLIKAGRIIQNWISKSKPLLIAPEIQIPDFPNSLYPKEWRIRDGLIKNTPKRNLRPRRRFRRAIRKKEPNILPYIMLPKEDKIGIGKKRNELAGEAETEVNPFLAPFNFDHILHPTSMIHLLNTPIRFLNHIHKLRSHVGPVVSSIPKVVSVSKQYLKHLLKTMGKDFFKLGLNIVKDVSKLKKLRFLPKLRPKRNVWHSKYSNNQEFSMKPEPSQNSNLKTQSSYFHKVFKRETEETKTNKDDRIDFLGNSKSDADLKRFMRNTETARDFVNQSEDLPKKDNPVVNKNEEEEFVREERSIPKKHQDSEKEVQTQTIKNYLTKTLKAINDINSYDVSEDLEIYRQLLKLDNLKMNFVKELNNHHTDNLTVMLNEMKEQNKLTIDQIIKKLHNQRYISSSVWINKLVLLEKLYGVLKNINFQRKNDIEIHFLRKLELIATMCKKDLQECINSMKKQEIKRLNGVVESLNKVLRSNNDYNISIAAKILWAVNNIKKLQKESIIELYKNVNMGLNINKELKIIFDLEAQLKSFGEHTTYLINS